MIQLGADDTPYRRLDGDFVEEDSFDGQTILKVDPAALTLLAQEAMKDVSHLLRPAHLRSLADILKDPEASDNDRFVARELLKNATIAARGVLPSCQDTGTAIVMGKKGDRVWTGGGDEAALSAGVERTYAEHNLRYSQLAPLSMFREKNTGTNLPAQIDLAATEGDEYRFLFMAKGGGSANKTYLYQKTKSLLNEADLTAFIEEKIKGLGTAACPPYYLSLVIGAPAPNRTSRWSSWRRRVTSMSCRRAVTSGRAFRDLEGRRVLELAQEQGSALSSAASILRIKRAWSVCLDTGRRARSAWA